MIIIRKYLLFISLVFISILAIGAVSAADNNNMTDDSVISASDADDLEIKLTDDEKYSEMNNLNNEQDILSDEEKETPNVNVDNVTVVEGDNVTVPFKVTDSNGSMISGEVNVTISGENKTISKNIQINNESDQFNTADLIEIIKSNSNWNISDIYDIITSCTNSTNSNISEIITGYGEVYNGLGLNISTFISGLETIINGCDVNTTTLLEGLQNIINNTNISMFKDGLDDMINASNLNFTYLIMVSNIIMDGFDLDFKDILNKIYSAISLNMPLLLENIEILNDEFDFSDGKTIDDILSDLNLKISLKLKAKILARIILKQLSPTEIVNLFNEFLDENSLTYLGFLERLYSHGFEFNFTNFIYKLINSDFNKDNVVNAINNIISSVTIDYTILNSVIETIKDCTFNSTKVISELENMSGINITEGLNTTKLITGLYKIIAASKVNTSSFNDALNEIISAFKFNITAIITGLNKINSSFNINNTTIMNGLDRIVAGLGINISSVVSKIIGKYGYFVTFTDSFSAGVYNITVKYLSNDKYNSAINDTAKLIVLNKKDSIVTAKATVNGYNVVITGSVSSNTTGIVYLIDGDYSAVALLKNGIFTYNGTFTPGYYNITVLYPGYKEFNKNSTYVLFTVKSPTKIVASPVYITYGTGKNLVITLKDAYGNVVAGKTIIVKLNGKQYTKQTDAKGQISIAVSGTLTPKTYTASVTFEGDNNYIKTTGTVKVVVSKAKTKITAKKKTFKRKTKTKKYKIVLKNNKGKVIKKVKVTLKVKGKTYKAKTNKKGKATFKITKLTKKGTFKAKIKFAGNKYYKAASKKVKIKIKK